MCSCSPVRGGQAGIAEESCWQQKGRACTKKGGRYKGISGVQILSGSTDSIWLHLCTQVGHKTKVLFVCMGWDAATTRGLSGRQNAFWALKLLEHRFNPKTPARIYRALMELISPGEIKAVTDVTRKVEEWEVKMCKVESEHGAKISDSIRVAVLISMTTKELQEVSLQMGKLGEELKYALRNPTSPGSMHQG